MTTATLEAERGCPDSLEEAIRGSEASATERTARRLVAERRPFDSISRETWDALAARNPWATPFARWAFHRAWWDAYGASAHDQTLVVIDPGASPENHTVAIAPLMHRHEVEPTDAETHTTMRQGSDAKLTPVEPHAKAIFFGASYHADYATLLAAEDDLPVVADAIVDHLASEQAEASDAMPWDVVDLRRLRCGDGAADELAAAFGRRETSEGWTLNLEREDVCPIVTLPESGDFEAYLGTLSKKSRHEIRRKVRRAEAVGELRLEDAADPRADLDEFIDLHQKRWGERGLFPHTPGGEASRTFFRRLFELFGPQDAIGLTFLTVGGRRIAAGVHFQTPTTILYYNAGVDPEARGLSPGVLMIERYIRRALVEGRRQVDFLRGDEPYKYEWGAADEPIQRLLVRRAASQ